MKCLNTYFMYIHRFGILIVLAQLCGLSACGGGSSGNGTLIEGILTEAAGVLDHAAANLRHEAGEKIEGVEVCALGACSTTDAIGQWGFVLDSTFPGGDVLFSIVGHEIASSVSVHIPENPSDVFIEFEHAADGSVEVATLSADGISQSHDHHAE